MSHCALNKSLKKYLWASDSYHHLYDSKSFKALKRFGGIGDYCVNLHIDTQNGKELKPQIKTTTKQVQSQFQKFLCPIVHLAKV